MSEALLLFDIDQTLIRTPGCGMQALQLAGRDMFGHAFSIATVDFAGRIDPLILQDLIVANGGAPSPAAIDELRAGYARHITTTLAELATTTEPPSMHVGVPELLSRLMTNHPEFGRAVLTGNYEITGMAKLRACGVPVQHFELFVWGDESLSTPPTRNDLPRVAMQRYESSRGRAISPRHTIVIGDTPHDVTCAHACGCRCLAVATGGSTVAQLKLAGANAVLTDLSDTNGTIAILRQLAFD